MKKNAEQKVQELLKLNKVIKGSELINEVGSRSTISRLAQKNKIRPLGSGYYGQINRGLIESKLLVLAKYYPHAVLVGHNALWIQGLVKKPSSKIKVQISNSSSLKNNLFNVQRLKKSRMQYVKSVTFDGHTFKTYPLEKLLCIMSKDDKNHKSFVDLVNNLKEQSVSISLDEIAKHDLDLNTQATQILRTSNKKNKDKNHPRELDYEDIIQVGYQAFCKYGLHGTSLKRFSEANNLPLSTLTKHFNNINDLKNSLCDYKVKELQKNIYEYQMPEEIQKLSVVDQVKFFVKGSLDNIDQHNGDMEFKFQAWAIAERHRSVYRIVNLSCGPAIGFIKNIIMNEVKDITSSEAEARAVLIISIIDGYNYLRWLYIDALDVEQSKTKTIENVKDLIINLIVPRCLMA